MEVREEWIGRAELVDGASSEANLRKLLASEIDYVLVEPGTDVLDARIVTTSRDGRYPSDHLPVVARVRIR